MKESFETSKGILLDSRRSPFRLRKERFCEAGKGLTDDDAHFNAMRKGKNDIKAALWLLRPTHWIKNLFVFLPMFFGGRMLDGGAWAGGVAVFFAFCFMASSIYCYNDIVDADDDRRHPIKCRRPIASGAVSVGAAYMIMLLALLASVAAVLLSPEESVWSVLLVAGVYYLLNLAYCSRLKQYAIVDVCIVAFGFVLRVIAGGLAEDVALSKWIVLMTFLLTLFLSFAKRRDDVLRMNSTGEPPRKNTVRYNLTFINQAITITASVTLVCYTMYTVSPEVAAKFGTQHLYLTTVFVLIGLLRYIQLTVVDERSGDPVKVILHDRFSQIVVLAWGLAFLIMIYVA